MLNSEPKLYDLFIIGGGINGAGIARDASGRGYKVGLAEMNDFASATSSSSTKLFHGGLRYLEFFEFRLVREALIEREILLQAMPHIAWPMRFVLPVYPDMRFDSSTPTSRLLSIVAPWLKGRRPKWLIRIGLFLYDHLGGRKVLLGTKTINLQTAPEGGPLDKKYRQAYEYSDCWVEDSRLTLLNIIDAQSRGAEIYARTKVVSAIQKSGLWQVVLQDQRGAKVIQHAKVLINAAGPWVENIIQNVARLNISEGVRLVRGSHIVTKRLYDHDKCYFFQGTDGRIMFCIPYEEDYTLIGTTDVDHADISTKPTCNDAEISYMIDFVNAYFEKPITHEDVVWTYSGVRPLYNDNASSATAATRDYVLKVDTSAGAPMLNIFGGKITTYRKLAEAVLDKIDAVMQQETRSWTSQAALPGGDFPLSHVSKLQSDLAGHLPFFDAFTIRRLIRQYGTRCEAIFKDIKTEADLGEKLGQGVTAREIDWAIDNEWVRSADDFLWRRSKLGLRFSPAEAERLGVYIADKIS